ncbi:MAG: hypothetical protein Q7I97_06140 [Thermovirgaceae bacterium]|nr:hypothetical protein [Thermovirgaceae bacterium]
MKKRAFILFVCLLFAVIACSAASAATVSGWGKQTRGNAGSSAKLEAQPVVLPSVGTITEVSCNGNGFWINDRYGNWIISFYNLNEAKGYQLPAGTYSFYPNLKNNQSQAGVTVTITY